jgi:hypothetical protein
LVGNEGVSQADLLGTRPGASTGIFPVDLMHSGSVNLTQGDQS